MRWMPISSKLPVYWKSVCLKMKGFTPAAYTQSRFQHLPATARSSGSPRLPHLHLMMEIILLITTSRQSDPDQTLVAVATEPDPVLPRIRLRLHTHAGRVKNDTERNAR